MLKRWVERWRGCGEKETLLHCWWECKLVQPLWRTVWRFLKKLHIKLPYHLAIPLLGIYLEKTTIWKDTCTPMFIAALFTIAKTWKQPKCPLTGVDKKMWYIFTMEYYAVIKKNEIMPFAATRMDPEIVILSEVSQTKTNITWYRLYVESKKMVQMNLFTKQKNSHRCRKQTYGYPGGKWGGDKLGDWDWHIHTTM